MRGEPKMVKDFEQYTLVELYQIRKAVQARIKLVSMKVEGR